MGVAVELMDAVVAKLNETSFGTATVERQIVPDITKKDLTPTIIVSLGGKASFELDRTREFVKYTLAIGLHYPCPGGATDHETALDMLEDIQDWLADKDNRNLTLASGSACFVLPFESEGMVDGAMAREVGVFFSITNFHYHFYKDRA